FNGQSVQDLDDDGWIDMPGFKRWSARPRLFWLGDNGASAFLTVGAMTEDRRGGTLDGRTAPDGQPVEQNQDRRRLDAGAIYEQPIGEWGWAQVRASGVTQRHEHRFGSVVEEDGHDTVFLEATLSAEAFGASWLGGVAHQSDDYRSETFPAFD